MGAPIIFPTRSSARPIDPMVMDAFATAAGEVNSPFDYIAEAVLPPVNMGVADSGATGTIQRIKADELIKAPALIPRAPGGDIETTTGVQLDPVTFTVEEWSRQVEVPTIDIQDTQGVDLYGANIANVWHQLKILQEARLDTFLMAGTWHPSDGNTSAKWNTSTGDPIKDIATAVTAVPGANAIVINREVLFTMCTNALVRSNTGANNQSHFIEPDAIARLLQSFFGLRLFVSGARKSAAGTETYVVRDSAWIGRVAESATEVGPRQFRVNRQGAVRMAAQIEPTGDGVRSSMLPSVGVSQTGEQMAVSGSRTLWLMEEWSKPERRGKAGSLGHREVLVQTSAVGGWVIGDLL